MADEAQLTELKNLLPSAKNVLIALPSGSDIDKLSAGLALFLSLKQQGKEVFIVCEDTIKVSEANLFGIDHVQKTLPQNGGGNLMLTLEGVAVADNTIPALEKLDWFTENNNLNLVFHVLPGQTFQPAKIIPHYQGGGFNLIIVLGSTNLNSLGTIYQQNVQQFSGTHIVDIDNQNTNTGFGQTNIIDPNAASISEMVVLIIKNLGLAFNMDEASNLLAGIFSATLNLTNQKVNAETFMAVAECLRVGGKKPVAQVSSGWDLSPLIPPITVQPQFQPQPEIFVPPVQTMQNQSVQPIMQTYQPSPEERPSGERVISESEAEPDWLTPKIFKGTSVG